MLFIAVIVFCYSPALFLIMKDAFSLILEVKINFIFKLFASEFICKKGVQGGTSGSAFWGILATETGSKNHQKIRV